MSLFNKAVKSQPIAQSSCRSRSGHCQGLSPPRGLLSTAKKLGIIRWSWTFLYLLPWSLFCPVFIKDDIWQLHDSCQPTMHSCLVLTNHSSLWPSTSMTIFLR